MIFKDKFNRDLGVGDIVATVDSYDSNLYVGKITKKTYKAIHFQVYTSGLYQNTGFLDMAILKDEPTGWTRWTKAPEKKLLILRKRKTNESI
tara:strand:- start:1206 stop:1481 length:276 start_codon:yes stop_codon:yes gene_type:complete